MSHTLLRDPRFHDFLFAADRNLAIEARIRGCPSCGGKLHSANYFRRPRGGLFPLGLRFSFCCAAEGCRRRLTPGSLRFLARKVYLSMVVVLASVMRNGPTPELVRELGEVVELSERTVARWRRWWREEFAASRFWGGLRGLLGRPVDANRLPGSLLERFAGDERSKLVDLLRSLVPITGGKGLGAQGL